MSNTDDVELRLKKRFHSFQHERMVVRQQNSTTISWAFRHSNF